MDAVEPNRETEHRFFHADCYHLLRPNTELAAEADGYSKLGRLYGPAIASQPRHLLSPAFRRELDLEVVRQAHFSHRASRLSCFFAARTPDDAARYAYRLTDPRRPRTALIYEVFAKTFHQADMMQLDIAGPAVTEEFMARRYLAYWRGEMSTDFIAGAVRMPLVEVMIPLPVRIGELVATATVR
jgi:hypothetical protein